MMQEYTIRYIQSASLQLSLVATLSSVHFICGIYVCRYDCIKRIYTFSLVSLLLRTKIGCFHQNHYFGIVGIGIMLVRRTLLLFPYIYQETSIKQLINQYSFGMSSIRSSRLYLATILRNAIFDFLHSTHSNLTSTHTPHHKNTTTMASSDDSQCEQNNAKSS